MYNSNQSMLLWKINPEMSIIFNQTDLVGEYYLGGFVMSRGLKVCATIWLIVLGLGSFIAACIVWSNARYYGWYSYHVDGTLVGIGFAVLFGGALVALTGFFLLSCIAEIAENNSVYVANYSEDRIQKMLEETMKKTMSGLNVKTDEESEEKEIADNLPQI